MDWSEWRGEFPILAQTTYLNSCSLGALSRRAEQRLRDFRNEWHQYGASAWYETWMGRLAELRGRVAGMLAADEAEIALGASVSAALSVIASAIDHRPPRHRVVVAELDFPTLAYQWLARPDVEVVRVPSDDGIGIDPQRWAEAIDERTAVVATSHVFFTTGAIQDLASIAKLAHDAGALFIVDAYQSAGQIPIDVSATGADVLIAGPLKWLLGGPGLAYTWVRPQLVETLTPTIAGWWGAEDQFDFDIGRLDFKRDARRFELGTPALHTVHTALGGQQIIDEIGVPSIRDRNCALTERLIARARDAGFELRVADHPDDRSAIVMIAAGDPHDAVAHLAEARIIVDARPGYVRVSPHFYNTEEEVERVVAELAAWREGRS